MTKIQGFNFLVLGLSSVRYNHMNNIKKVLNAHDIKQQSQRQPFYKIKHGYTLEIKLSGEKNSTKSCSTTVPNDLT